jgi:lysophospholipase L1-like esterase
MPHLRWNSQLALLSPLVVLFAASSACSKSSPAGGGDGGARATGGSTGTGGTTSVGGSTGAGGSSAAGTGGHSGSGGADATGGVTSSGGSTGAGGTSGSGGTSPSTGTAGTGGRTDRPDAGTVGGVQGGATASGGRTGSGGSPGSGGATTPRDGAADSTQVAPDAARDQAAPSFDPCPATGTCKILPLGDSITAGAGAQPGEGGGYRVELFSKALADSKHITYVGSLSSGPSTVGGATFPKSHEGHIGYKIDQISALATTSQALKDSPHIILLFIGTNDEGYASSAAGASDRLAQLIDKIVAALPDSLLVVSSIYPFPGCKDTNYTPTVCAANVATYDAAIPGIVKQSADQGKHVLYIDMSNISSDGLSTDGVHPNATVGYPWMGDNWYGIIGPYLH